MLSSNDVSFSERTIEILKRIIKDPCFREINEIVRICNINSDENNILQNIKDYIWSYLTDFSKSDFISKTQIFINFFKSFISKKAPRFLYPSKGSTFDIAYDLLPISNGYHIDNKFHDIKYKSANGLYSFGSYLGTDHNIYLGKLSMNSRNIDVSHNNKRQVDYNSIIAQSVFEYFDEPVAEYYLLHEQKQPYNIILTRNFLNANQELIHFSSLFNVKDLSSDTHFNRIRMMEKNIELRYRHVLDSKSLQLLIDKLKLQYCKQQFLKLLIGPMDVNTGNTALLITNNPDSNIPDINISPAYDLDISFNVSENLVESCSIFELRDCCQNPVNIFSFIQDFKDIPGFKEYLENLIKKINHPPIIGQSSSEFITINAYKRTNFNYFKLNREQYVTFLNDRFKKVLEAYKQTFIECKGDEEK